MRLLHKFCFRSILTIFLLLPVNLLAGWVITGRFIDREGRTILKRYFIQDNLVKVERYNLIYTCDLNTGSIIMVDPEILVFTQTNLNELTSKILTINNERLDKLLNLIPEDQKSFYKELFKVQSLAKVVLPENNGDSLSIEKIQDSIKLLGHNALKYKISVSGRKKEEFFFTPEVDISGDFNWPKFLCFQYLIEPEDKTIEYLATEKYLDFIKNGLVLRRFIYQDGYRSEWQVNNIETKTIPGYEFGKPALCKEISIDKWLGRAKKDGGKYYDDYE